MQFLLLRVLSPSIAQLQCGLWLSDRGLADPAASDADAATQLPQVAAGANRYLKGWENGYSMGVTQSLSSEPRGNDARAPRNAILATSGS